MLDWKSKMKRLAFRKSTGAVIPDFQSKATEEGLTANAVKMGIPVADVEVREISDTEYATLEDQAYTVIRAQAAAADLALRAEGKAIANRLGLSNADLTALKRYLSEV